MNVHKECCFRDENDEVAAVETILPWHDLRKDAEWCRCLIGPAALVIEDDNNA